MLDEGDIVLLKTYGQGSYAAEIKKTESEIEEIKKRVNESIGTYEG